MANPKRAVPTAGEESKCNETVDTISRKFIKNPITKNPKSETIVAKPSDADSIENVSDKQM